MLFFKNTVIVKVTLHDVFKYTINLAYERKNSYKCICHKVSCKNDCMSSVNPDKHKKVFAGASC